MVFLSYFNCHRFLSVKVRPSAHIFLVVYLVEFRTTIVFLFILQLLFSYPTMSINCYVWSQQPRKKFSRYDTISIYNTRKKKYPHSAVLQWYPVIHNTHTHTSMHTHILFSLRNFSRMKIFVWCATKFAHESKNIAMLVLLSHTNTHTHSYYSVCLIHPQHKKHGENMEATYYYV